MAGTFVTLAAQGQVAAGAAANVLTASSATLYMHRLTLHNSGATQETVLINVENGGSLKIAQYILQAGESAVISEVADLVLENGDDLMLGTTNATTVNWFARYASET